MKTTTRFRPSVYTEEITEDFGIECFYNSEKCSAILYAGKSSKPVWHYGFVSYDLMMIKIKSSINNIIENEKMKLKEREEMKKLNASLKASDYFKVGDIVVNTWGWEQSNVDYYQVTDVLNKKIRVKEIGYEMVEGSMYSHGMACEVVPIKDSFLKNGEERLLSIKATYWNGKSGYRICNPERYYYFEKWNGRPEYKSWYA